jgi:hypothetical protein
MCSATLVWRSDEPTDWWIARILAPTRGLREALPTLRVVATDVFSRLPYARKDKCFTIVGVGWARPEKTAPLTPVLTWVTNCAGPNGWLPEALDEFSMGQSMLPAEAMQIVSAGQPVTSERCGQLAELIGWDHDRYGRTVTDVVLADGRSLNHVHGGYAWWFRATRRTRA